MISVEPQLGDLIQYRYKFGGGVSRTVREVVGFECDADGKRIYVVDGGYWVRRKDVLAVIVSDPSEADTQEFAEPVASRQ